MHTAWKAFPNRSCGDCKTTWSKCRWSRPKHQQIVIAEWRQQRPM